MVNLNDLYSSFIDISNTIKFGPLEYMNSPANKTNSSNESITKMDLIAHNTIIDKISNINNIIGYISEESTNMIYMREYDKNKDNYILAFDPIDGSKNILSNVTVGTIYCLYKFDKELNKFTDILEAGYCLYGPRTILVKTNKNVVEQFTLDNNSKFIKDYNLNFNINKEKIYSINHSNSYSNDIKDLLQWYKSNNYNQRWIGSMVADCHQILSKGGIFMYPNSEKYPKGKLRLLYEVIPFSYIFKIAGGIGLDNNYNSILDKFENYEITNDLIHQNTSVILCSNEEYIKLKEYLELKENMWC
jgi:fructose-1,6-bisphosphatase I